MAINVTAGSLPEGLQVYTAHSHISVHPNFIHGSQVMGPT